MAAGSPRAAARRRAYGESGLVERQPGAVNVEGVDDVVDVEVDEVVDVVEVVDVDERGGGARSKSTFCCGRSSLIEHVVLPLAAGTNVDEGAGGWGQPGTFQ